MAEPSSAAYPSTSPNLNSNIVNQVTYTVSGSFNDSVTTITVAEAITLSAPQYLINTATGEIIYAETVNGSNFENCKRGADGTTADAMTSGQYLRPVFSANLYNQLVREIDAIATEVNTKEDDVTWGDGLTNPAGTASVDADTASGLKFSSGKLQVSLQTNEGLAFSSGALGVVDSDINHDALTNFLSSEHVPVIDEDAMGSNSTGFVPTQQSVKAYVDNTVAAYEPNVTWGDGLGNSSGTAFVDYDTAKGLTISTGKLAASIDTAAGIAFSSGKLQVALQANQGLGFSSGALGVVDSDIDHDALTNFLSSEHVPVIDEDAMGSNSTGFVPTQQSVKAYVDNTVASYEPDVTWGDGLTNPAGTASVDIDTATGLTFSSGRLRVSVQANQGLGFSSGAMAVVDSDIDHDALTNFSTSEHFTQANITTVGTVTSGNVTAAVSAATSTLSGKVELATTAEINGGTDTGRVITPDGLSASVFGTKRVVLKVFADTATPSTGTGLMKFTVPPELNGMNLVDADAAVYNPSTSGSPTFQLYNATDSVLMLSTAGITIDSGEYNSYTAASQPSISTAADDVVTGDILQVNVLNVGSTATQGGEIHMGFRLP